MRARLLVCIVFFFQAEDGIRDTSVTGVQTCALPISSGRPAPAARRRSPLARDDPRHRPAGKPAAVLRRLRNQGRRPDVAWTRGPRQDLEIGRASCRERGWISGGAGVLNKRREGGG